MLSRAVLTWLQRSVLSTKKVVGMTINGAALNAELLEQLKPGESCAFSPLPPPPVPPQCTGHHAVVVTYVLGLLDGAAVMLIEEGAEILEPLVVAALSSSLQHVIMIGDHKQLRPVRECLLGFACSMNVHAVCPAVCFDLCSPRHQAGGDLPSSRPCHFLDVVLL
jgi:hypothetical protein